MQNVFSELTDSAYRNSYFMVSSAINAKNKTNKKENLQNRQAGMCNLHK